MWISLQEQVIWVWKRYHEALRNAIFCDNSRESLNLIKTNIEKCGAQDQAVVLAGDYTKALSKLKEQADVIFLDPPYQAGFYEKCLELIDSLDLLTEDGIIIAEHGVRDQVPDQIGRLTKVKERKYGKIFGQHLQMRSGG